MILNIGHSGIYPSAIIAMLFHERAHYLFCMYCNYAKSKAEACSSATIGDVIVFAPLLGNLYKRDETIRIPCLV